MGWQMKWGDKMFELTQSLLLQLCGNTKPLQWVAFLLYLFGTYCGTLLYGHSVNTTPQYYGHFILAHANKSLVIFLTF